MHFDHPDRLYDTRSREQLLQETVELRHRLDGLSREITQLKSAAGPSQSGIPAGPRFEWLAKAFERNPLAMMISRFEDGTIEHVNPSFLHLFGYTLGEVIGKSSFDLGVIVARGCREANAGGEIETDIRTQSNRIRRALLSTTPFEADDECRILTIIQDITDRKSNEEALRQTNKRFELAAGAARIGTYSRNFQTGEDYWSPGFRVVHGLAPDDVLPLNDGIPAVVHPEDRPSVLAEVNACLDRTKQPEFNSKHRIILPSGEIRWVMLRGVIEFDPEGRPLHKHGVVMDITEREQEQEALRESESFYRQTLESIPGMVFTTRPDGHCDYQSQQWVDYTGVPLNEHLGTGWNKLLHPDDRSRALTAWEAAVQGKAPYDLEYRVRRHDGHYEWFRVIGRPIRDASGSIVRWLGMAMNIEKLKRTEEELRMAYGRLQTLFDQRIGGIGVVIGTAEGEVIVANDYYLKIIGHTRDELLSGEVDWRKRTPPEWLPANDRALAQLRKRGVSDTYEKEYVRPDGTHVPVLNTEIRMPGNRGEILAFVLDITERKKMEKALREREERLRLFIEHAPASLAMFDREMRYISVSRRWLNDYRLGERNLIGLSHYEVFPEISEKWKGMHRRALAGEVIRNEGDRFVRADGSVQWLRWELRPWRDEKGAVAGIVIFTEDITARKEAEASLQKWNENLERCVAERTQLAESRARQLQALAVELIEAEETERRRIAGLLHEDLQQLLAGARFVLQSASAHHPTGELEEVERLLEESIRKSRHLSHELSPAVLHQSGFNAALEWLARKMGEQYGLRVALERTSILHVESAPLSVFLFRAVQELLFNVVKHAGVRSAAVGCSIAGNRINVSVCDSGKGFEPAILEKAVPSGGLGLLSLRERASYIGGELSIESTPGAGSRLTLSVPLGGPAESARVAEPAPEDYGVRRPTHRPLAEGTDIRVLFADDHKVMRQGLIRLISGKPNISVIGEAANGREALELTRQLKPDVVVMDVSMPEMDGIEATRQIKAALPNVRVIGLSMHEDEHIARTMRDAGAETFLSKTASSSLLLKAIYGIHRQQAAPCSAD